MISLRSRMKDGENGKPTANHQERLPLDPA